MRGVVQRCARGSMGARQKPYRLYSCGRCARQVRICCECDRGNRYCAGACAKIRRRESLLRAGERYQLSYRGACGHAARQSAWRSRQAQKVTHQGSLSSADAVIAGRQWRHWGQTPFHALFDGRPLGSGVARRPASASILARNRSLPKAQALFVASRIASMSALASCPRKSCR